MIHAIYFLIKLYGDMATRFEHDIWTSLVSLRTFLDDIILRDTLTLQNIRDIEDYEERLFRFASLPKNKSCFVKFLFHVHATCIIITNHLSNTEKNLFFKKIEVQLFFGFLENNVHNDRLNLSVNQSLVCRVNNISRIGEWKFTRMLYCTLLIWEKSCRSSGIFCDWREEKTFYFYFKDVAWKNNFEVENVIQIPDASITRNYLLMSSFSGFHRYVVKNPVC